MQATLLNQQYCSISNIVSNIAVSLILLTMWPAKLLMSNISDSIAGNILLSQKSAGNIASNICVLSQHSDTGTICVFWAAVVVL